MDFDFHKTYSSYSNVELLKILRQPESYQPTALAAAENILKSRDITIEDERDVAAYFRSIESKRHFKASVQRSVEENLEQFINPENDVTKVISPKLWVNILLIYLLYHVVVSGYKATLDIGYFINNHFDGFGWPDIVLLGVFLVNVVLMYMVFKRKRWGWILVFSVALFTMLEEISNIYIFFRFQSVHHGNTYRFLLGLFISIAYVLFLWRPEITGYFKIDASTKRRTALVTGLGTILIIAYFYVAALA